MQHNSPFLSEEEAIKEFEAEVARLQEEFNELDRRFLSGAWALSPTYAGQQCA